jgi:protein TonB
MRGLLFVLLCVPAVALSGGPTAFSVATLVHEKDEAVLQDALREGIAAPEPLVRATAARVIAMRGLAPLLPLLRESVKTETDATAAREQLRALAFLGDKDDVAAAAGAASRFPAGMDNAVALAVARRGGVEAVDLYRTTLRTTRMTNAAEFFRVALWGRGAAMAYAGSRLIGSGDEPGWRGLLGAFLHSNAAMHAPVLASSLTASDEGIRSASVWYVVHSYAADPRALPQQVREKLLEPRTELSSDREDFGLELARRMLGGEKKDDPRWQRFIESIEADELFAGEDHALQYLTDEEYRLRYMRCEVQVRECAMPKKRSRHFVPSIAVAPPAIDLPSLLPAGLADAILKDSGCSSSWIGVIDATVDPAGRVQNIDLARIETPPSCKRALETLLRVSYATNTSLRSPFTSPVLLVRPERGGMCLDEAPPADTMTSTLRVGGAVEAPKVLKRAEPRFPESARHALAGTGGVAVVVESVIAKEGCVRNLRLLEQSPYPELNGAALMALSQWKFAPGQVDGKPADVLFNLTINFELGM